MRQSIFRPLGLLTTAIVTLSGCVIEEPAPDFDDNSGQKTIANEEAAYPEGPTGYQLGDTIPDFQFVGYADYVANPNAGYQVINLSDFYNPTGQEVFPADSPYGAGNPKPKALNMLISTVWCGPCKAEALNVLPGEYTKYKPLGGQFLGILLQNGDGGPAAFVDLDNWSKTYQTAYSMVIDPAEKVTPWYTTYFPNNMIIRTKDMHIIRAESGAPNDEFWADFDAVLDDTYQEPAN